MPGETAGRRVWDGQDSDDAHWSRGWPAGMQALAAQRLSRGLGSPSPAPGPSTVWPPLHLPDLSNFPFPLSQHLPPLPSGHGSPFLSTAPCLSPPSSLQTPGFSLSGSDGWWRPMEQPSPAAQRYPSPVSNRVGSAPVGTLCPGSPAKAAKAGRGPSLLRRTCQVQLALSV